MLGTNLSYKDNNGAWQTNTNRLILMDRRDFNKLGLGIGRMNHNLLLSFLTKAKIFFYLQFLLMFHFLFVCAFCFFQFLSTDDLIDGYVQTVLCAIAIDTMSKKFISNGEFNFKLFSSINYDKNLLDEIKEGNLHGLQQMGIPNYRKHQP